MTAWTTKQLNDHLQYAIDLEFWTIVFYRTVLHSLPDGDAKTRINEVSMQEMFHTQCACNIANALGYTPNFQAANFIFEGNTVPHLNFGEGPERTVTLYAPAAPVPVKLHTIETHPYFPFTATLGELNEERINTMCLIEYPHWSSVPTAQLAGSVTEYDSIAHFYKAVQNALSDPAALALIQPGRHQVNPWGDVVGVSEMVTGTDAKTTTPSKTLALAQINALIGCIIEEGEGSSSGDAKVEKPNQFRGDTENHSAVFEAIKESMPVTGIKTIKEGGPAAIQNALLPFLTELNDFFGGSGAKWSEAEGAMYTFDGAISSQYS